MIVSIINMKGGTGKTTSALALACAMARAGRDVAVYDADPQSSASLWAMTAEENGEALPFPVESANLATVRQVGKKLKGDAGAWAIVDCPPNGRVMDEAASVADMVVIPASTGPADLAKAVETAETLSSQGVPYAILLTMTRANTLSLRQTVGYLEDEDESYFETEIPAREAIKNSFGHDFGSDLFGYEKLFEEIEEAVR